MVLYRAKQLTKSDPSNPWEKQDAVTEVRSGDQNPNSTDANGMMKMRARQGRDLSPDDPSAHMATHEPDPSTGTDGLGD